MSPRNTKQKSRTQKRTTKRAPLSLTEIPKKGVRSLKTVSVKETDSVSKSKSVSKPQERTMFQVEQEIARVEALYRNLTGNEPPRSDAPYAPIPPEADAEGHVHENLRRLYHALQTYGQPTRPEPVRFIPRVNVLEGEKQWACQVELPGVTRDNVNVEVNQGNLVVRALRDWTHGTDKEDDRRMVYSEADACHFERVLQLPPTVRWSTPSTARLENGVLSIEFEKDPNGMRKDVQVEVG